MIKFKYMLNDFENKIKKNMGIKKIMLFDVKIDLKESKLSELEIELKTTGRDVQIKDITISDDNTLEYMGKKVVLYMRDQYFPTEKKYKYHIAWCDHLEDMEYMGKIKRYVVNNRKDGKFAVNLFDSKNKNLLIEENKEIEMEVCVKCLSKLQYEGFVFHPHSYKKAVERFNLEEFFKKYTFSWEEERVLNSSKLQPINSYSSNWKNISRKYREYMGWFCEECGKDCTKTPWELEVHHKNSNKFDSSRENLKALCHDCHEKIHEKYWS